MRLLGYLPGPPVVGFHGMFEGDFGCPDTPEPLSTIVPSSKNGQLLPFACPGCDQPIDFGSKSVRDCYHDGRRGRDANGQHVVRDNYFCPGCGYRFKLNLRGMPLNTSTYGRVIAPSRVMDADGTVTVRNQITFLGSFSDRYLHAVTLVGAGSVLPARFGGSGRGVGGAVVSPAQAAMMTRALSVGERLVSKGKRLQKKKKGMKFGTAVEKLGKRTIDAARKAEVAQKKAAIEQKKAMGQGGIKGGKVDVKPIPPPSSSNIKPLPQKPMFMPAAYKKSLVKPRPIKGMAGARVVMGDDEVVTPEYSEAQRFTQLSETVDAISNVATEMVDLYELLPVDATKLIYDGTTYLNFLGAISDNINSILLGGNAELDKAYSHITNNWNDLFKGWMTTWIVMAKAVIKRFGPDPTTVKARMEPVLKILNAAIVHARKAAAAASKIAPELSQEAVSAADAGQVFVDAAATYLTSGGPFSVDDWSRKAQEAAGVVEAAAKACDVAVASPPVNDTGPPPGGGDPPPGGAGAGDGGGGGGYGGGGGGGGGVPSPLDEFADTDEAGVPKPHRYYGDGLSEPKGSTPDYDDSGNFGDYQDIDGSASVPELGPISDMEEYDRGDPIDIETPPDFSEDTESVDPEFAEEMKLAEEPQEGDEVVLGSSSGRPWSNHLSR